MLPLGVLPCGTGGGIIDTGDIGNSLRFRGAQWLSFTPASTGNRRTWALWGFIHKTKKGVAQYLLSAAGSSRVTRIGFDASDRFFIYSATASGGGDGGDYISNRVFRDATGKIPFYIEYDSTQATAADRIKAWIGDEQITSWATSTAPTLNHDSQFNWTGAAMEIGRYNATNYLEGYGARLCLTDGTKPVYTAVGYRNTEINEWVPKTAAQVRAAVAVGGGARNGWGTNGCMLGFGNGASLTTLGYDVSQSDSDTAGNNWVLNGFSLTGANCDHHLDVPGNSFCTINNIAGNVSGTAADGNLKLTTGTTHTRWVGTMAMSSGGWVWEGTCTTATGNDIIGILRTDQPVNGGDLGDSAYGYGYQSNGSKKNNGTTSAYGASYTSADVIRLEYNATAGELVCFKNSVSQGVAFSGLTGEYYPAFGDIVNASGGTVWNLNFGQAPLHASATYHSSAGGYFRDAPTAGFKALCQANLPAVAIPNPKAGFVSVIDTEANIYATLAAARSSWGADGYVDVLKNRDALESWAWQFSHDSSNEYAVAASSLTRQAKRTQSGSQSWYGESIRIGTDYGTAAGSVSHTNGAATTITHNIGKSSRQMIMLFNRAGGTSVPVHHADATAGELLDLCTTAGDAASTAITNVLTNSFQIGSGVATGTYDYLVMSEISGLFKLGKHSGNSSADGPYGDAGGKVADLTIKRIDSTGNWQNVGSARNQYNPVTNRLLRNMDSVEAAARTIDLTGFGFKLRETDVDINVGGTYVTASHLAVAGKFSLGR